MKTIRSILEELLFEYKGPGSIDQALDEIEVVINESIGEMEYRETEDMELKTWSAEDLKAFGRNELRNEIKSNLHKALGKE